VALGVALARPAVAAGSFVVIVNAANPASHLDARQISDLFLKKVTTWPDGTKAAPVDLTDGAPARASFSQAIHHKSVPAVGVYWQKMIFSGREVPPPEKASPEEVVRFVKSRQGAIGYVPVGTELDPGVKVLAFIP
jgi:ABC-type phosphate transport system substrate-binding protein